MLKLASAISSQVDEIIVDSDDDGVSEVESSWTDEMTSPPYDDGVSEVASSSTNEMTSPSPSPVSMLKLTSSRKASAPPPPVSEESQSSQGDKMIRRAGRDDGVSDGVPDETDDKVHDDKVNMSTLTKLKSTWTKLRSRK